MKKHNFWLIVFLISILSAVGQITNTIYVPAMGHIANDLLVRLHYVQLLMVAYLLPYGFSQFFYGVLSDHIGRKKTILFGLSIYILGSVITVAAPDFKSLLLGSLIQGSGIGVAGVMCRTVMRDLYEGHDLQKANSIMSMILIFAPLIAPLLGGMLTAEINWRAIFIFLLIFSIIVLLLQIKLLPETNRYTKQQPLSLHQAFSNFKAILNNKQFLGYTLIGLLIFSGIAVFEACAGLIFGEVLHYSVLDISFLFITPIPAYLVGSYFAGKLIKYYEMSHIMIAAMVLILMSGLAMVVLRLLGFIDIYVILVPMAFYLLGSGLLFPSTTTYAIMPFPALAGSAGALMGGLQNIGAGISTFVSSNFRQSSQLPLALILTTLALLMIVIYWKYIQSPQQA